jgi:hypothetical protein
MRRGEDSHTAEGLAIAARAALADAMTRPEPCLSCLQRAEEDARRAIALDGRLADCHVWLATSLGYEARIQGVMRASWSNSPAQAKEQLDAALAIDPANAYALAALGGWHVEIVRVGGAFLASKVYDASLEKSLALFDRAGRTADRDSGPAANRVREIRRRPRPGIIESHETRRWRRVRCQAPYLPRISLNTGAP